MSEEIKLFIKQKKNASASKPTLSHTFFHTLSNNFTIFANKFGHYKVDTIVFIC